MQALSAMPSATGRGRSILPRLMLDRGTSIIETIACRCLVELTYELAVGLPGGA